MVGKDLGCPHCGEPLTCDSFNLYDLDAADQCEDGRFGPETVSIQIFCRSCNVELLNLPKVRADSWGPMKPDDKPDDPDC